ncbi:cytochrome P450 monooxygenase [Rhizodiscina lignyota]|uniref:Cytochrome P450 monooxygenase n=1 Tax=Rhizodiscina lignyota TaxID=1504668 RepID=A0A9P4I5G2_9PEZI|nr:cytochrome P450 monooxygenase [Rhizodiscina lignyota]
MLGWITTVVSVSFFFLLFALKPIYDYLRDPKGLRRFHGMNWLAPFTNIPYMYYSSQGRRFKVVHEAHKKHTIVRVGPNSVSFNDVVGVRDIYGHGSPALKDEFYNVLAGTHRHLADVQNREEHSRKRRVLAGAYSQAHLIQWEHVVADRTSALVAQYDRLCEKPEYVPTPHADPSSDPKQLEGFINHRLWSTLFGIDAICEIGMSAGLRLLENGNDMVDVETMDGKPYRCSYRESLWYAHRVQSSLVWSTGWFKHLRGLTKWHPFWRHEENYTNMVITFCKRRLQRYQAGEKLDDFYAYLLEDKYGNANMLPMGELVAECSIMMNAGSDTTATALTNALYNLLKHPDCFQALRRELDAVLEPGEVVAAYDRIKHLPYLRACLDESMRLNPPNTMNVPRLTPPEGLEVMGEWIPGNTTVHSPPYSMHRNPSIFPDPESFRPERWLAEDAQELQPHFITFSAGARGCIGRNITYLEQYVAIATLVHRYDFELISPDWVLPQREAFTCSPGDLPVRISRRQILGKE